MERGQDVYKTKYEEMANSEKAYRQIMPDDIMEQSTMQSIDENASKFLFPAVTIVAEKIKKELSVNNPQFLIKGTTKVGEAIQKEFEDKIAYFFSSGNWGFKSNFAYHYLVTKGTMVTRTIMKRRMETILTDNGVEQIGGGSPTIDIISYDPMTVVPDYDADPKNWSETAKWCIITIGYYSANTIKQMFPKIKQQVSDFNTGWGSDIDIPKRYEMELSGKDLTTTGNIPVREYYTNDGWIHTIVNDSEIVESRVNDLGLVGKMPINICPLKPDPNNVFGFTHWHFLKNTVACASRVMNQVLDNNELNNEFPLLAMKGADLEVKELGDGGRKVLEVNLPMGMKLDNIIQQMTFREITNGAQFLFNITNMLIQQITGITNESLGVRERQMRVAGEAEIINRAILTNSSDIVLSLENSYINPTIWDMFRIFYRKFEAFKFKSISKEFLTNFEEVRVANGSTLSEDKINKQQLAQILAQIAGAYPNAANIPEVLKFYMSAFGAPSPEKFINSPEQLMAMQQSMSLAQRRVINNG